MAERLSKHCWATPKCGISFAEKYFRGVERDVDFTFIMVRNPYSRLVSFYINKVVYQGNPPWAYKNEYKKEVEIPHLKRLNTSISFERFLKELTTVNLESAERHLRPQYRTIRGMKFDHVVRLEQFKGDIKKVCDVLEFNYDVIIETKSNAFPRNKDLREYVGDWETKKIREHKPPKEWRWFYTEDTKNLVYKLYEEDFVWLKELGVHYE